jgi:hypothetical protein
MWPFRDFPTAMVNVRVRGQSRKYMLALSFSQFDPKEPIQAQTVTGL